jgi:hypothetical protein
MTIEIFTYLTLLILLIRFKSKFFPILLLFLFLVFDFLVVKVVIEFTSIKHFSKSQFFIFLFVLIKKSQIVR